MRAEKSLAKEGILSASNRLRLPPPEQAQVVVPVDFRVPDLSAQPGSVYRNLLLCPPLHTGSVRHVAFHILFESGLTEPAHFLQLGILWPRTNWNLDGTSSLAFCLPECV